MLVCFITGMFVYIFCFKVSATFSNFCEVFCSTEWFEQQQEFTNEIENMEVDELNKCLAKFSFPWGKPKAGIIRNPACCRSEPPSTDILKPQNLSKICLFFVLFSRIIINVIIPKQLVASGNVNIGEVRLGDYSPIFTSPSATKMLNAISFCLLKVKTVLHNVLMDSV